MQELSKISVAIVTGGYSGEREVSLKSAGVVSRHLNPLRYICHTLVIDKDAWYYLDESSVRYDVNKSDFSVELPDGRLRFDVVFIALHGSPGEDGKMQGYLDMLGLPYSTCDTITSALTFDKHFTKQVALGAGILTAASVVLNESDPVQPAAILDDTGLPCFVKPNCGGSSVGMSKVKREEELVDAVLRARKEDKRVIIEQFIGGTEVTCGVLSHMGSLYVLPLTEIVSKKEFFDYEAKYTAGMADEITPARVDSNIETTVKAYSSILYREFNCHGVVRFDYIVNPKGIFFLEVNTVPGLSEASIVPQQVEQYGWSLQDFFGKLVEDALWRHQG